MEGAFSIQHVSVSWGHAPTSTESMATTLLIERVSSVQHMSVSATETTLTHVITIN
jgi:hypothetical protein